MCDHQGLTCVVMKGLQGANGEISEGSVGGLG